ASPSVAFEIVTEANVARTKVTAGQALCPAVFVLAFFAHVFVIAVEAVTAVTWSEVSFAASLVRIAAFGFAGSVTHEASAYTDARGAVAILFALAIPIA